MTARDMTNDQMIDVLAGHFKKYGVLGTHLYRRHRLTPPVATYHHRFGSWAEPKRLAIERAGIDPSKGVARPPSDETAEKFTTDFSGDKGSIETNSTRIKSLADALACADVDLEIWEVDRYVINKWEVGAKIPDEAGKDYLKVEPLYQVKVWLKRKTPTLQQLIFDELAVMLREKPPKFPNRPRKVQRDPHLLELSLYDTHIGMLAWQAETGQDYDLKIAEGLYHSAIEDLISKTTGFPIEEILLVVGQDFFHINNAEFTTQKGTHQDTDSRLPKIFATGHNAVIDAVDLCLTVAPVEILWVPGNHDTETSFFLCKYLQAYYRSCGHVTVDVSPTHRKYKHYGVNLIGFTHGNEEPHRDLPTIMAGERRDIWSEVSCCEWHVGHFHKQKETRYSASDTFGAVGVRVIPSLSGTDAWHYSKGYVKTRKVAEAYLWSRGHGYTGHFSTNIRE